MHAHVTFYKNHLVIELLTFTSIVDETAVSMDNPSRFGQVIMNTSKNLGVSQEALDVMKTLGKGRDSLGDIDWFKTDVGGHAFSWIGGPCKLCSIEDITISRDWNVGECNIIRNDVPAGAKSAIDNLE